MTIGIIGAMDEEIQALRADIDACQTTHEGDFILHRGHLCGHSVLLAKCGVGKVNGALLTQLLIQKGAEKIVFTGVAGGVDEQLEVGDIVISTDALQHDVDVTALKYEAGHIPGEALSWRADEALRTLAAAKARELAGVKVLEGRVVSGDQFIADRERVMWLRKTFGAACAEMEGAAVAQACGKWTIPFVIIRSISDTADEEAATDFRAFTVLAAERAKRVVRGMLESL